MKKSILFLCFTLCVVQSVAAQDVRKICDAVRADGWEAFAQSEWAQQSLKRKVAAQLRDSLIAIWKNAVREQSRVMWSACDISNDSLSLKFDRRIYGAKPSDGRSLYISLHGGGGLTHEFNDHQWDNQTKLYKPAEGVYISPRAPWDAWNMWFKPGLDQLFEQLIQDAIAWDDVNPSKVYLLGYSAGGDGVWRMAPRMPDYWAAASMMAGHPGEAEQVNLLNVPFMIWMGELDAEYNRNSLAAEKGLVMDSLQRANADGYVHSLHIVKGKGHWMEHQDTAAIAWMAKYKRIDLPKHVVWRQEDVVRPFFYWLSVNENEARTGMRVEAKLSSERNEVEILQCDYKSLNVYFNDDMLNLDKPIRVTYQGRELYKGMLQRTPSVMVWSLSTLGDPKRCFYAKVSVKM